MNSREDASDTEKTKMLLSRETIEGLYITGKCAIILFCSCTVTCVNIFSEIICGALPETFTITFLRIRLKIISVNSGPVVDGARTQLLVRAYHLHSPSVYKEARQWSL